MNSDQVWFITGSSSGFGKAFVQLLVERGNRVVATARDPATLSGSIEPAGDRAVAVELDVTNPASVRAAVFRAEEAFGRVDVLVNNAGWALGGALEEWSDEMLRKQFETNLFGAISVTRAVLPIMRRQRSGTIVQISSAAGLVPIPAAAAYVGSKFALEGVSEALALEVAHLGIDVMIVQPGRFRTEFNKSAHWSPAISDYAVVVDAARQEMEGWDGNQPGDPVRGAQAVITALDRGKPPRRLPLGADALSLIRAQLAARLEELDLVEELGRDTEFAVVHRGEGC